MTTVKQLKEFLNQLPDDCIIRIISEEGYVPFDITNQKQCEFIDYSTKELSKSNPFFKKKVLFLGEE